MIEIKNVETDAKKICAFHDGYCESIDDFTRKYAKPASQKVYSMTRQVANEFVPLVNKSKYDGKKIDFSISIKGKKAIASFPENINPKFVVNMIKKAEKDYKDQYLWESGSEEKAM